MNRNVTWITSAAIFVAVVLFGVRWSSGIMNKGPVLDEKYITVPINDIITKGWTVETAIDFQETKGPAMIWQYAFFGKMLGGTLNDLRLISVWSSLLCLVLLTWVAVRSAVYRKNLYYIAIGWLLIPYNLVFSEIVMGEVSFLLLSLFAVVAFIWGIEENAPKYRRFVAPLLYCVAVSVALHSRIHVVALTGGICFTAFALLGLRSWPWWVASVLAGLLRIPLWMRWGGLVSPEYQTLHGLGFRLESLSYLAGAMVPFVGVFAIEGWRIAKSRLFLIISFCIGVLLVLSAMPDLVVPSGDIDYVNNNDRFQGIAATLVKRISLNGAVQQGILASLAGVGLAGLAGLWVCKDRARIVGSITFWSLTFGWLLYAMTRGFVFDRFLLTWAFLLPIVWFKILPKRLLIPQYVLLTVIAAWLSVTWL
ncbi:MAG TPA: hypothetical protein EYN32_05425 [Phycisphaerales bacterium]|nr:hypothetical protein [Phycisphaerales bacterium]